MVFDVANKEFGIAQPKPNPTVSAVVWFDGASAKNPPCYAGATSPRAHVCDTAIGLAAIKGFRILRNLYANQPSPGRDQASVTTTPPSNADRAASSHARRLALGLRVGTPLGLMALALGFTGF